MNPYPNKCPLCNSPARRNKSSLICSNVKCKSWKNIRTLSAKFDYSRIKQGRGLTSDDPIIIYCSICNYEVATGVLRSTNQTYCHNCGQYDFHNYIKGRWYYSNVRLNTYTTRFDGGNYWWDWQTELFNGKPRQ